MGLPSVEEAASCLARGGLAADIGNPGGVMPHLTRPLVAVNLLESTVDSCTMIAHVCGPMSQGRNTCENVATLAAEYWAEAGAQCCWGDYSFDSKAAMHIVKLIGVWKKE